MIRNVFALEGISPVKNHPTDPAPAMDSVPSPAEELSEAELLDSFESIGDNCEIGWLQKMGGIDRMALLKWSCIPLPIMAQSIAASLPGIDDPKCFSLEPERENGRTLYTVRHQLLQGTMLALLEVGELTEDVALDRIARRTTLLCRKFLQDANDARRVYVYRCPVSDDPPRLADVMRVHEALCIHGANRLLYVHLPTKELAPGDIKVHYPGFVEAAIDQLTPYHAATTILTKMWPDIFRKAYAALPPEAVAARARVAETCT